MSETRSFLARWSERKRAEARVERPPESPAAVEADAPPTAENPPQPAAEGEATAPLDLEALPSLDDITGDTDIGAFLRRGVPGDLRNEALRRVWSSDPTISRFIEMADYDWDFNAPGGNQVFGPLSAAVDAARMAAEILNPQPRAAPERTDRDGPDEALGPAPDDAKPADRAPVPNVVSAQEADDSLTPEVKASAKLADIPSDASEAMSIDQESSELSEFQVALRNRPAPELESPRTHRRRRHGGALPDSK